MISLLIIFFLISIVISLLCSLWESVLLSITPGFVQLKLDEKTSFGVLLGSLKKNIDQPLAAILTLNTVAHTVGAIGVGQQASIIWADSALYITTLLVPIVMTLAILILSEIIPKTIGAIHWKTLAPFTIYSLSFIIKLLKPFVWFCQVITTFFSGGKPVKSFNRKELLALTQIGTKEGRLSQLEATFIENVLNLNQYKLVEIMTPRSMISAASELLTLREFYDQNRDSSYSRIPVFSEDLDNTTGFVLWKDVLKELQDDHGHKRLKDIKRSISFHVEMTSVFNVYKSLIQSREHMVLIVDEYGGVSGLVTMEDIIECFIGEEIVDETDRIVDLQAYSKEKMKKKFKHL